MSIVEKNYIDQQIIINFDRLSVFFQFFILKHPYQEKNIKHEIKIK